MPGTARSIRIFAAAIALACAAMPASAKEASGFARLSWLAGCWNRVDQEPGSVEQWLRPAGGTMLGIGRTVKAGKTEEFEFMRIHEAPDGKLLFTAIPTGRPEATFTQLRLSDSEAAFENPTHDYPQRVIYRRDGAARVLATIDGMYKGAPLTLDFPMRRVKCDR